MTPAARTELSSPVFDFAFDHSKMIPAWTEARLQKTLQNTLSTISKTHHVCFFIDRLDEISGNQDDLVALIERIIQDANVKVCLSSRPYRVFEDGFGPTSKLRLQDLTEDGIQRYVSDKLNANSPSTVIGYRAAEGIFLSHIALGEQCARRVPMGPASSERPDQWSEKRRQP